jgi:hypothetical protein
VKKFLSLEGIAAELNARGILAARGGKWYATTVRNFLSGKFQARNEKSARQRTIARTAAEARG